MTAGMTLITFRLNVTDVFQRVRTANGQTEVMHNEHCFEIMKT